MIAAVAVQHGLELVTGITAHFQRIHGSKRWYVCGFSCSEAHRRSGSEPDVNDDGVPLLHEWHKLTLQFVGGEKRLELGHRHRPWLGHPNGLYE
jgi:hypothetical protein